MVPSQRCVTTKLSGSKMYHYPGRKLCAPSRHLLQSPGNSSVFYGFTCDDISCKWTRAFKVYTCCSMLCSSFLCISEVLHCMDISHLDHRPSWRVLLWAHTYMYPMSIHIHVCKAPVLVLWGRYVTVEFLGHIIVLGLVFEKLSHKVCSILQYHQQNARIMISLHPCQHLFSTFIVETHPGDHAVPPPIMTGESLVTTALGHPLMCLLARGTHIWIKACYGIIFLYTM